MNTSYKKCDIKPWNIPDQKAQQEMIKKIEDINKECNEGKAVLLFSDAVHQLHTTNNWYAVQFKWKMWTKVLASNTGRKRYTIVGAVNPKNYKTSYVSTDGMCNVSVIKLLIDQIVDDYDKEIWEWKTIYMILDNARYQRANEVQLYAKEKGIMLCFLPPYCPHLNLIERLRKRLKKKLRNQYIELFSDFCNTIENIISNTQNSFEELKTLLTINFGVI